MTDRRRARDSLDSWCLDEAAAATRPGSHQPTHRWWASGALSCHRQRWYSAHDVPREPASLRAILAMDIGAAIHDRLQAILLAGHEGEVEAEVAAADEALDFSARADLLVRTPVYGHGPYVLDRSLLPMVVEVKSVSDYAFRRYRTSGQAEPRHVVQALHSVRLLQAVSATILYVSRDSFHTLLLTGYSLDDVWERRVMGDLADVALLSQMTARPARYIPDVGPVPDPTSAGAPWQCRYCPYLEQCVADGEGGA